MCASIFQINSQQYSLVTATRNRGGLSECRAYAALSSIQTPPDEQQKSLFNGTVFISRSASPVSWLMQDAPSQVLIVFKTTYPSYECCISCVEAKYEIQEERICQWRLDTCAFNINPLFVGKHRGMSAGDVYEKIYLGETPQEKTRLLHAPVNFEDLVFFFSFSLSFFFKSNVNKLSKTTTSFVTFVFEDFNYDTYFKRLMLFFFSSWQFIHFWFSVQFILNYTISFVHFSTICSSSNEVYG